MYVPFESSLWARFHGSAKTYTYWLRLVFIVDRRVELCSSKKKDFAKTQAKVTKFWQFQIVSLFGMQQKRMAWLLHILESDLTRWQLGGISIWPSCQWQPASLPALSWPTWPLVATGTLPPWQLILAPTRRTRVTGTASYLHHRGFTFTDYQRI